MLFLGGVQLISVGILGRYLARVHEQALRRPLYVVRGRPQRPGAGLMPTSRDAVAAVADVEGWLTPAQATRLWERAAALTVPARVVEIGSYRGRSAIVLAMAARPAPR